MLRTNKIYSGIYYSVEAIVDEDDRELDEDGNYLSKFESIIDICNKDRKLRGYSNDMIRLISGFCDEPSGPRSLPSTIFHRPQNKGKIWSLRKGSIRFYCFYSGNKVVVITHGYVKREQKPPPIEIKMAEKLRLKYLNGE